MSATLGLKLKSDWGISLGLSSAATDGGGMDSGAAAVTSSEAGLMMPLLRSPNETLTAVLASFALLNIRSEGDFSSGSLHASERLGSSRGENLLFLRWATNGSLSSEGGRSATSLGKSSSRST